MVIALYISVLGFFGAMALAPLFTEEAKKLGLPGY
jgi:hypothetical protein